MSDLDQYESCEEREVLKFRCANFTGVGSLFLGTSKTTVSVLVPRCVEIHNWQGID